MLWLEMSRDSAHGGPGWEFSRCLWSPAYKKGAQRSKWPYWDSLLRTRVGDNVLHLRGIGKQAAFVGLTSCEGSWISTIEKPPAPGQWAYADEFYRVPLRDWRKFSEPISLPRILADRREKLIQYFVNNKTRGKQKRLLFYVLQDGKLQCLNGAYLSEVDDELAELLLGVAATPEDAERAAEPNTVTVSTGEALRQVLARVGQDAFSEAVKANYEHRCCVPGCDIRDSVFLVGSHIARWADVESLRGNVSNGLSLCLMHDRAFENGFFTFDASLRVVVSKRTGDADEWIVKHLLPLAGERIRVSTVEPSIEALEHHWSRNGFGELSTAVKLS